MNRNQAIVWCQIMLADWPKDDLYNMTPDGWYWTRQVPPYNKTVIVLTSVDLEHKVIQRDVE